MEHCDGRDLKDKKKGGKGKGNFDDSSDEDMGEDDDDEDADGGLSDEEVDFGDDEDDELAAEFRREMEGLGAEGDEDEEDGQDDDFSGGKTFEPSCPLWVFFFIGLIINCLFIFLCKTQNQILFLNGL